jgi:hypothetical protein
VAALLVDGHDRVPARAAQAPRERAELRGVAHVAAEEDDPGGSPLAQRREDVRRSGRAREADHDELADLLLQREPVDRGSLTAAGSRAGGTQGQSRAGEKGA